MANDKKTRRLSIKEIILKGSIISLIVTIPSIFAFLLSWTVLDDLVQAVIIGAVIHFIAMGFSLRISKLLIKYD